jgi:hypothetical protein
MARTLKKELETYERTRDHLLATHEGEFVLIHGCNIIGCFGSEGEAIGEGYRRLGQALPAHTWVVPTHPAAARL